MPGRRPIFALLLREKNAAADDALVAALPGAPPAVSQAIVETLVARNRPVGLRGLVRYLHHLPEAARQRVLEHGDHIFGALRESFASPSEQTRLNVVDLIRSARLYRAAYLLDSALHDRQPAIRERAADALHGLANALLDSEPRLGDPNQPLPSPEQQRVHMSDLEDYREDRRQLASALATGLLAFSTHLQPKVVEAAMWLVDDIGSRFWGCISTASARAHRVAITILEQSHSPRLVPFAIQALTHSELRPHVLRLLTQRCDREFLAEWIAQGWRLAEPRLARAMVAIKELACLEDRAMALLQMPPRAERHLARWIRLTGLPGESRTFVLKELYRRGDSALRRSTLAALCEMAEDRALSLLRAIATEQETECGRLARLELARRFPSLYSVAPLLPESQRGSQGSPAAGPTDARFVTLDRYWNEYDHLSEADRHERGRKVLAETPRAAALLARQLTNAEPEARVRAVRIISTLGLVSQFNDALYALSYDAQPEVRSAAVLALGQTPGPTTTRILHQALVDPDARVQANAVEAFEETGELSPQVLLPKLASQDNRVRANAVKALLKLGVREAAETLVQMLQHADRRQRISGLWLVEKMGLLALAGRVVRMADADQDPQVRARAADIRQKLAEGAIEDPVEMHA